MISCGLQRLSPITSTENPALSAIAKVNRHFSAIDKAFIHLPKLFMPGGTEKSLNLNFAVDFSRQAHL